MADHVELRYDGKKYKLPIIRGTEKEEGIDLSALRKATGLVTLDIGYKNTGSTTSGITFLNGEKGILRYRGYSIEELAAKANFVEVAYLLIYGELPTRAQFKKFDSEISRHTLVHEEMKRFLEAYPTRSHPMGQLCSLINSLSSFYPESLNPYRSEEEVNNTIIRLLAKMPTLVAMIYKNSVGHPMVYPTNKLDYADNFLKMMFGYPTEEYKLDKDLVDAMDALLILHADHEQNCSTSTVRIVGSAHSSLYTAIAAGISALWGPRHGGANQAVIEMLEKIRVDGGDLQKWIDKAKDKNDPFRLMGFGHRVYKNFDPRAKIIKKACDKVLKKLGVNDPILGIAKELEAVALKDEYFVSRKLYPNVDFYSGIIYRAMGFPTEMFTVLFALGRLPGWIAQWREMMLQQQPIGRPRQIYTGSKSRKFTAMSKRKAKPAPRKKKK